MAASKGGDTELTELRKLRTAIKRAADAQAERLEKRAKLAQRAKDKGATWTAINEACGVANMQATLNDRNGRK